MNTNVRNERNVKKTLNYFNKNEKYRLFIFWVIYLKLKLIMKKTQFDIFQLFI